MTIASAITLIVAAHILAGILWLRERYRLSSWGWTWAWDAKVFLLGGTFAWENYNGGNFEVQIGLGVGGLWAEWILR